MTDFHPKTPGKYRRSFDWRVSHGTRDSIKTDTTAMVRLSTSDFPDILEDFLDISRKRSSNNPTALARLQIHMLEELMVQESAIRHYRDNLGSLQEGWKPATPDEQPPKEIDFAKQQLFFYRLYANAVRAIGDGIAWRAPRLR
jgi:hypothetical protein